MPEIDPRLLKILQDPARDDAMLEVVVRFDISKAAAMSGADLQERRQRKSEAAAGTIQDALLRAGRVAGMRPMAVSSFPSLGSALVKAGRPFMKVLLDQEGVVGAVLNSSPSE